MDRLRRREGLEPGVSEFRVVELGVDGFKEGVPRKDGDWAYRS